MSGQVNLLLRLEGLTALFVGLVLYERLGESWLLFALLFLVPDASMIGYLRNPKLGAAIYNAGHTYLGPAILIAAGWWTASVPAAALASIWLGHIGFDRLLGFGLKSPSSFRRTHLGPLG